MILQHVNVLEERLLKMKHSNAKATEGVFLRRLHRCRRRYRLLLGLPLFTSKRSQHNALKCQKTFCAAAQTGQLNYSHWLLSTWVSALHAHAHKLTRWSLIRIDVSTRVGSEVSVTMEESNDKPVKHDERRSFTRFKCRSYEVYSSFKEFIDVASPTSREPKRVKSLSFKKRRLSQFVEPNRNMDGTNMQDNTQNRQIRASKSQPDLCTNCQLSITNNDDLLIQLHGEVYHIYCFRCIQCGNRIDPKVDYILIEDDRPLCRACGETIVSNHVHVIDKDFHEKCLLCTFCRKVISK